MKPDLYICHTPYQVLADLCRAMQAPCPPEIILSTAIPDAAALARRLADVNVFCRVRVFDEAACGSAVQRGALRTLLLQHLMGRRNVEKYYGFSIEPSRYGEVYIHNDWSVLGRYLQDKGVRYILCEDTFASSCGGDASLIADQQAEPFFRLRRALGYGYLYWGDWKGVKAVESECAEKAHSHFWGKVRQRSQQAVFRALTGAQKALIQRVFITAPLPQSTAGAVLLLPRDLVADRLLDQTTQQRMYRAVVRQYCQGGPLFIKAHPRDPSDYAALFPDAVVLERTMPSEVLNFALPFRFVRAVTVESTVLKALEVADEKLELRLAEALALPGAAPD